MPASLGRITRSRRSLARSWPLASAVALLLGCVAIGVRAVLARTNGRLIYALDDAYIHMAIAKNLARHGVWGCTPVHFSASSSSLLWPALLGVAYAVSGVHDVTPLVFNMALAVATLAVADHYLSRFAAPPVLRATALLGMVVACPLPGMVLLGMEHLLHLLLTIAFVGAAVVALVDEGGGPLTRRQEIGLCVLSALVCASRYEGVILAGLVCLVFVASGRWRRALAVGGSGVAPIVAFGILSMANGSLFFPNPLMVKAGGETASLLSVVLQPIGGDDLVALEKNPSLALMAALGVALSVASAIALKGVRRQQVIVPLLLALMAALHAHFAFSSTFWVYRYDAYLIGYGIFAVAAALSGHVAVAGRTSWRATLASGLSALAVAAVVARVADLKGSIFSTQEVAAAEDTYLEHYMAARFVQEHFADQTVVVNDLGAVSYFTDAPIIDMFGLGDIEPLTIRRRTGAYTKADVEAWTGPRRPTLAMVQLGWAWVVPRVPDDWLKAAEVEVPPSGQTIGFFAASHDFNLRRKIEEDVASYYGPLAETLGYRVHVF